MTVIVSWNNWWFFRLSQNLLSYASVAVPGGLIVYYLKKTKYLESQRQNCFWKFLSTFVHGSNENFQENELNATVSSSASHPKSVYRTTTLLMFCFTGLQISYLTWGILQEKIMTQEYHNTGGSVKFSDSQFLVFINRVLAFIFAGIYVIFSKQSRHKAPLYKYAYCSFSNIMSSWCQYEALKYVSFPTQVLAKASKIIPVMLMGKIVSNQTYKYHEYVTAAMISTGMALFLWSRGESLHGKLATVTTASGVIILLVYILSDSFTSNWQGELFKEYHMSSVQMMCGVNFFSCIFTFISLLQLDTFSNSFTSFINFPDFFIDCILLSICSAVGQMFIFYTISNFGPVAFVIMMTVRQALAILLSCLIYNHKLTLSGLLGVIIVFSSVFLRIYLNYRTKLKVKSATLANEQQV